MLVVAAIGVVAAVLAFIFGESPAAGSTRAAVKRTTAKLPTAARSSRTFVNAHADGVRIVGYVVGLGIVLIWLSWTAFFIAIGVVIALAGRGLVDRTGGRGGRCATVGRWAGGRSGISGAGTRRLSGLKDETGY